MLLTMEGFDNDHIPEGCSLFANGDRSNISYSAGRGGQGRALRYYNEDRGLRTAASWDLPASPTVVAAGACNLSGTSGLDLATQGLFMLSLREGGTTHVGLRPNGSSLELLAAGVIIHTVADWSVFAWHHYALEVTVGEAGAGAVKLFLDGSPSVDLSGIDTMGGGTGVVDNVRWESSSPYLNGDTYLNLDDVVIQDGTGPAPFNAFLGDCRVQTLRPSAPGVTSEWVGSDGDSVDNWALIDDNTTTTDYIASGVAGAQDLSSLSDLVIPVGTVLIPLAVQAEALVAKSDAGTAPTTASVVRGGAGAENVGPDLPTLNTDYRWGNGEILTTDLDTGEAWSIAAVNALQAGVENGT